MSLQTPDLKVSLWRGGDGGSYESYRVPLRPNQTVLDVVTWIQRNVDPSLTYRFACRVGVCGSCAMSVNGTPRWTCRTHVSKVVRNGALTIGPLENLPVIKDLATDMAVFFEKWQRAQGVFAPSKGRHDAVEQIRPDDPDRQAVDAAIECINCGVCYAACDTVRWDADYLGPAALNRAWSLVNDARDLAWHLHQLRPDAAIRLEVPPPNQPEAGKKERLEVLARAGGCFSCHSHQSCQQLCPQALNPTEAIAGLKRRIAHGRLKGEVG